MTFMPPEWECLPSSVSRRLDYLLSSLSLCLRFATLTQFPPTSDFRCFVFACQGSIASRAAIFAPSVDGDYTAPEQDSRAAADDRSTLSRIAGINAALPSAGITFRRQKTCASPRLPIKTLPLWGGVRGAILFPRKENSPPLSRPHTVWGTFLPHEVRKTHIISLI